MKIFAIVILIIIGVFTVNSQINKYKGKQAYEYFKEKCEAQAGEFIYRTVDNVEGLYQMRLRDPRGYFDRMRYGDIPEDPYGHTNSESQRPWVVFVRNPNGRYQFLETKKAPSMIGYESNIPFLKFAHKPIFTGQKFWRYELIKEPYIYDGRSMYRRAIQTDSLKSRYGFSWREVRNEKDLEFNVWGGEISVHELQTNEVLAVKKGFVFIDNYTNRSDICPKGKHGDFVYDFVSKVLKPKNNKE